MNEKELTELLAFFPKYRKPFFYFKDRYALLLLSLSTDDEVSKQSLKKTAYSKLLDKAVVKETLGQFGGKALSADHFDVHWPKPVLNYTLTLGQWGHSRYTGYQTSRRGFNLVLQLNFGWDHDRDYLSLDPSGYRPFENRYHPIAAKPFRTLAWARLDVDLVSGEVLIEEIQTDWVRNAKAAYRIAEHFKYVGYQRLKCRFLSADVIRYVDEVLAPHSRVWDEAMLAATLWFVRRELGIRRVYYHSHETGAALKKICYSLPPRSLYTQLPKKFCFAETRLPPAFLRKKSGRLATHRRIPDAKFHSLEL